MAVFHKNTLHSEKNLILGEGSEEITKLSFKELKRKVAVFAEAMKKAGVQEGDRVAGKKLIQIFWRHKLFYNEI